MKTKIKNLVTSALLGVAVLGGAVLMQSFKDAYADLTWYFTGDDPSEITDASKWSLTAPETTGCEDMVADLPCDLNTPSSVNSQLALQNHFQSQYLNNGITIKNAANSQREL